MRYLTTRRACSVSLALVALVAAPAHTQAPARQTPPLAIVVGGVPVSSTAIGVRAAPSTPVLPESTRQAQRLRTMTAGWARTNDARVSSRRAVLLGALVGAVAGTAPTFAPSDCRTPGSMCGPNIALYAAGGALAGGAVGYVVAATRR
jgi:hypothetical protein